MKEISTRAVTKRYLLPTDATPEVVVDPDRERRIEAHAERVEREQSELRRKHTREERTCSNPACTMTTRDWYPVRISGAGGKVLCRECHECGVRVETKAADMPSEKNYQASMKKLAGSVIA